MHLMMIRQCFYIFIFLSVSVCCLSQESDTISAGQSLFPNQTLVSKQGKFEVGFFSPGNSRDFYVGIWYKNISVQTVVWVANRNSPIRSSPDNCRLQTLNGRLNLMVNSTSIWVSEGLPYGDEAVILDSGNLVLRNASGIVWQSFAYPTDTWLPNGMIGFHRSSNVEAKLVSWRDIDDPASGNYSLEMARSGEPELQIKKDNGSHILWRSGALLTWGFPSLINVEGVYSFYYVEQQDIEYFAYNAVSESNMVRGTINSSGSIQMLVWHEQEKYWATYEGQPNDTCNKYNACGRNGICDFDNTPHCGCLDGYAPRGKDSRDFSQGCVRMRPLNCSMEFVRVGSISLPANPVSHGVANAAGCKRACSENCTCMAYALDVQSGCLLFIGDMLDLKRGVNMVGAVDLYVKMDPRRPTSGKRNIIIVALVVSVAAAAIISYLCFCNARRKLKNAESHQNLLLLELNSSEPAYNKCTTSVSNGREDEGNNQHGLPIFSFSSIAESTDNFSTSNKLGEGGFGPVYKGGLRNGQSVAVKRLSGRSGQGLEEFRNETELIAKLQHRNLVSILGCCIENDEMILVYEYMPNKSLDFFLFEPERKEQLVWRKRVGIIEGIAQGLMYLHHYSRLRIVHRDLKASNILLDAEMNPKISDFGMARIFGGNDSQANTKRIVGTFGYMSPEYAMEGLFSVKSDVFAFGVLLLEILSGKKNTGFYGSAYLSLLGYAWNMWQNDSAIELIDSTLDVPASSFSSSLRCIQIGLLCVQDNPTNRPDMSQVVAMLNNKDSAIALPQRPAFTEGRNLGKVISAQGITDNICSVNGLTFTQMDAR